MNFSDFVLRRLWTGLPTIGLPKFGLSRVGLRRVGLPRVGLFIGLNSTNFGRYDIWRVGLTRLRVGLKNHSELHFTGHWKINGKNGILTPHYLDNSWFIEVELAANRIAANRRVSMDTGRLDILNRFASSCWVILMTFWLNWALLRTGSTAGTPIRFSKSQSRADLIFMSMGVSQLSEGLRLTSRSQGLRSESINMSKPYNSKQFRRWGTNILQAELTGNSTEMMDLIITSSIDCMSCKMQKNK